MVANTGLPIPGERSMNVAVQEVSKKGRDKNTGFPEPLSPDRNTTLRHPAADTSPNASIDSNDVPISRTHSRVSSRHSFGFGHRHKNSRVDGPIDMNAIPAEFGPTNSDESIDEVLDTGNTKNMEMNSNGTINAMPNGVTQGWSDGGRESTSEEKDRDGNQVGHDEKGKRGGVLRKLHFHH